MKVVATVNGVEVRISCGAGEQTLKWLGLVAAQRFALQKPKGRARLREDRDARVGFRLPQSMTSERGGELKDPNSRIRDVLQDGGAVQVTLQDAVEVDEVGAPTESEWFIRAFWNGEATRQRLKAENVRRRDAEAEAKLPAAEKWDQGSGYGQGPDGMGGVSVNVSIGSVVVSGPLDTVGEIRAALEHDWRSSGLAGLIQGEAEQQRVRALLQEHLSVVNELYLHYCGPGTPSLGSGGLTYHEFAHLLHAAEILHALRDSAVIEEIFGRVTDAPVSREGRPVSAVGLQQLVSRAKLQAAFIMAAQRKEGPLLETLGSVLKQCVRRSEALGADEVRAALKSADLRASLEGDRSLLYSVFGLYADEDGRGVTMTLANFREMMDESGLLLALMATTQGRDRFTSLTERAFFGAQDDPPVQNELPQLVFCEFVEAAARLSEFATEGPVPLKDKIHLVMDCMIELGLSDRGLKAHK